MKEQGTDFPSCLLKQIQVQYILQSLTINQWSVENGERLSLIYGALATMSNPFLQELNCPIVV